MTEPHQVTNPMSFWTDAMTSWTDLGRNMQATWMDNLQKMAPAQASEEGPAAVTQDMFRRLADRNLEHWEKTARMIDAMPEWMRWPQTVPGGVLTDWFDKMRRAGESFTAAATTTAAKTVETLSKTEPCNVAEVTTEIAEEVAEVMTKPAGLDTPPAAPDDLTKIKGIGPKLSNVLNDIGIYHFSQMAEWTAPEAAWIDDYLSFKGRTAREQWIEQAQKLAANGSLH